MYTKRRRVHISPSGVFMFVYQAAIWRERKAPICKFHSIYTANLWCQYSHHGQFQATDKKLVNMELEVMHRADHGKHFHLMATIAANNLEYKNSTM